MREQAAAYYGAEDVATIESNPPFAPPPRTAAR
jgi:hypothetical protein